MEQIEEESLDKKKNPKWLRRLERESWQAELLVSGVALFGCLQLPNLLYSLADFMLNILPIEQYFVGHVICFANLLAVAFLTAFFFFHFVLRAYWIGLIGLNSVFPEGHKTESKMYSPLYTERFVKLLTPIKDSIISIDKMASTQFAGAFALLLMYGAGSITMLVGLITYNLVNDFIPPIVFKILLWVIGLVFIASIPINILALNKKFRFHKGIQTGYYYSALVIGYFSSTFLFKPVYSILYTFSSNAKSVKSSFLFLPYFLVALFICIYHLERSNIATLRDTSVYAKKERKQIPVYAKHYSVNYRADETIFLPTIPTEIITEKITKLFIPILRNEDSILKKFCGEYVKNDSLNIFKNQDLERDFERKCYPNYHSISINNQPYSGELFIHTEGKENRFGLTAYLTNDLFKNGKNTIEVIKHSDQEGGIYKKYSIPAFYSKE